MPNAEDARSGIHCDGLIIGAVFGEAAELGEFQSQWEAVWVEWEYKLRSGVGVQVE